jgi:hypothetical protein
MLEQGLHLKDDFVGKSEKDRIDGLPESLCFPGGLSPAQGLGGKGFDAGKRVGLIGQPFGKSDATDPVQDQIGVTVGLFAGGPDESGGSNFSGAILERHALLPGKADHTEEAVSFEGFIQHLAISIFKNVEGKCAMGKEGAIREKDCTQVFRKFERGHEAGEMKGCENLGAGLDSKFGGVQASMAHWIIRTGANLNRPWRELDRGQP